MEKQQPNPRVGVGVMIQNSEGQVLLGLRQGAHGAGEWSFPGGHLDFGETLFECARREVLEETGLDVAEFYLVSVADEMRYLISDNKHYLNIGVRGVYNGGEPQLLEPNKCKEWNWFDLDALPGTLFEGTAFTLRNFTDGKI